MQVADKDDFSPAYYGIIKVIDTFTEWTGQAVSWVCVPLALVVFWEVVARFFFGAPTIWAYDLSYMFYSVLFMLGAHYALKRGAPSGRCLCALSHRVSAIPRLT